MNFITNVYADMSATVERVQRTLVVVRGRRDSAGAGLVWRADGIILTNNHVLNGRIPQVILPDGSEHPAQILARDEEIDLALLEIPAHGLPPVQIATLESLEVGQLVFAIGHPWGRRNTVTAGVLSALTSVETRQGHRRVTILRTDAGLAPGNSGGPLVNAAGAVIGINTMIVGGDQGFAIPAALADEFARQNLREALQTQEGFV
jgi:serine protease Do